MKRPVSTIIIVALLVTGTAAKQASAAPKITLLYTAVSAFIGSWVAKDQGFFDQRGIDVDLSLAQNGSELTSALVSDSAQIGGPTPTVLLQADEQGLDLVIVAGTILYPQQPGANGLLARTGSGFKGAPDLVGKKVGVPGFGGFPDILTKKWVQSKGIDYHTITWVEIPFQQESDALKSGLIDAVGTVNPFYRRIITSNVGYDIGDIFSVVPPGTSAVVYTSTRSWVAKNAEAVKAFRAALDDATAFIADASHAGAVRTSIAKFTKLPPEAAATVDIPISVDAHAKPQSLQFWIDVSREQGLIKGNPNPASLIAP